MQEAVPQSVVFHQFVIGKSGPRLETQPRLCNTGRVIKHPERIDTNRHFPGPEPAADMPGKAGAEHDSAVRHADPKRRIRYFDRYSEFHDYISQINLGSAPSRLPTFPDRTPPKVVNPAGFQKPHKLVDIFNFTLVSLIFFQYIAHINNIATHLNISHTLHCTIKHFHYNTNF